jgi:hypothetical protein
MFSDPIDGKFTFVFGFFSTRFSAKRHLASRQIHKKLESILAQRRCGR